MKSTSRHGACRLSTSHPGGAAPNAAIPSLRNARAGRIRNMANHQATANSANTTRHTASAQRRPGEGTRVRPTGATSERDDTYGLISVIYHSLQGAETYAQYAEDARRSKDEELVSFFEECRVELDAR